MKKNLILSLLLIISASTKAQVVIGKNSVTNSSVSLEFSDTENRGIILPLVENKSGIITEGTIIFDTADFKAKYLKSSGNWVNLSGDDGTSTTIGTADLSIQGADKTEYSEAKTSIGTPTGTDGILVF